MFFLTSQTGKRLCGHTIDGQKNNEVESQSAPGLSEPGSDATDRRQRRAGSVVMLSDKTKTTVVLSILCRVTRLGRLAFQT
jgi:hypothetical protein